MKNSFRLVTAIDSFVKFILLNLLFFCVPKRKVAKEKGTSRGRYFFVTEINSPKSARVRRAFCITQNSGAAARPVRPDIRRRVKLLLFQQTLAVEREVFRKTLIERNIMTASEIKQFHTAIKNHAPVQITRRWLNEIASSIEEYDKRNANIDTLNNILERIEFVDTILEGDQ